MSAADLLRSYVGYTEWASLRLLGVASALTPEELSHDFQTSDRNIIGTLAHLFAGDRIWLARLSGAPVPSFITEADRDMAVLQVSWPALLGEWQTWAAGLTEEQALGPFTYTDLKGRQWTQPVWQLVMHVVNHGTHHRGQVAGFLRSLGHIPPSLDLHYYYRQA